MATFYLDGTDLANSTAVYTDEGLTTLAPDQFYSDGSGIVREQVNGLLLPSTLCPTCAFPCANLPNFPDGEAGRFPFSINIGGTATDVGQIVIRFLTGRVPDGIRITYDGDVYNGLTSSTAGWKQSSNTSSYTFLGSTVDAQGNPEVCSVALQNATSTGPYTPTLNNFVLDIPNDEWDPDGTSTQVTILAGDLQFETNPYMSDPATETWNTMVINKPNQLPSTIDVEIISDCENTGWQFEIDCPQELGRVTFFSDLASTTPCGVISSPMPQFYRAGYNGTDSDSNHEYVTLAIYDLVYYSSPVPFGIIPNGNYRIGWTSNAEVDTNGVVTNIEPCLDTVNISTSTTSPFTSTQSAPFTLDDAGLQEFSSLSGTVITSSAAIVVSFKPSAGATGVTALFRNNRGKSFSEIDGKWFSDFTSSASGYVSTSNTKKDLHTFFGEPTDNRVIDMEASGGTYSYTDLQVISRGTYTTPKEMWGQASGSTNSSSWFWESNAYNTTYTLVVPCDAGDLEYTSPGFSGNLYLSFLSPSSGGGLDSNDYEVHMDYVNSLGGFSSKTSPNSPAENSSTACSDTGNHTIYRAGSDNFGSTPILYDFVYSDSNGKTKLGAGYYGLTAGGYIQVDSNGVIINIGTCP